MEYNLIITDYLGSLHCSKQSGDGYAIHLKPERNIMNIPQMAPIVVALAAALNQIAAIEGVPCHPDKVTSFGAPSTLSLGFATLGDEP
jgi:hypothetical protein